MSASARSLLRELVRKSTKSFHDPWEWTQLHDQFDLRRDPVPQLPARLVRVVGLTIQGQKHPALVLSSSMAEKLEWACRQNRKTRRILNRVEEDVQAIEIQEQDLLRQQREREAEMDALEARLGPEESAEDSFDRQRYNELVEVTTEVEKQRQEWAKYEHDLKLAQQGEVIMHGNRVMRALEPLEDYLEPSGVLNFNTDDYLNEMREAAPAMRDFYAKVRQNLFRYQQDNLAIQRNELDLGNITILEDIAKPEHIPTAVVSLAAEFDCRQHELQLAQAEFEDRAKANEDNKFRWEQLGIRGSEKPSREEFDLSCLREDIRKSRNLQRAEEAMANVRLRLSEYITLSDVDSVIPNHPTPVKGTMNTAAVRAAKSNTNIKKWCAKLSPVAPEPRSSTRRLLDCGSADTKTLGPEDSYSIVEQNRFRAARRKKWEKLQEARCTVAASQSMPWLPHSEISPKRQRSLSASETSDGSNSSNKRLKPLWSEVDFC